MIYTAHQMSATPGIPRTRSLDRAIDVLEAVADSGRPASASALARATGQPRPTVSRTLRTLADRGLVAETARGWVMGQGLFRLTRLADPRQVLIEAADGPLRRLRDLTGESALLSTVTGRTAMEIVVQLDAAHHLGVVGWVGADVPLHASAAGKLLLAELSRPELEAWVVESRPARLTARTIVTFSEIDVELARVRRRGFAEIVDELEEGLVSLAAPVRDRAGNLVAMIGVSGPTSRLDFRRRKTLPPALLEAAGEVERALGPPPSG
jgi:DNA-binding IclR family transcriptional regulator